MAVETISYEEQRLRNIKENEALLLSLGLTAPGTTPKILQKRKIVPKKSTPSIKQRPADTQDRPSSDSEEDEATPRRKKSRLSVVIQLKRRKASPAESDGSLRRSGRGMRKLDYGNDGEKIAALTPTRRVLSALGSVKREREFDSEDDSDYERPGYRTLDGRQRLAQKLGQRIHNPKKFGHIPGVAVGRWWASRMDASTAAIHAPTVAGISGNAVDGAYSVALSGGYPDDVDMGVAFTYTGSGGRDLKGTKQNPKNLRTAPQTSHQTFENPMNAALKRSAETRKPVRVIRGFKLDSPYAPVEGYRYDGLYVVERAWMAKGLTKGLMVCRYAFKRLDGQPDLPTRSAEDGTENEA